MLIPWRVEFSLPTKSPQEFPVVKLESDPLTIICTAADCEGSSDFPLTYANHWNDVHHRQNVYKNVCIII